MLELAQRSDPAFPMDWTGALAYVAGAAQGWRLPTLGEARLLWEQGRLKEKGLIWTSSPYTDFRNHHWYMSCSDGYVDGKSDTYDMLVQLVRETAT